MYKELFVFPVFFATLILVLHSYKYRGKRKTAIFWGLGFVIMFIREYIYQNVFYGYRFSGNMIGILNVPLAVPMGWLFAAYISQFMAEYILNYDFTPYLEKEIQVSRKNYETKVIPLYAFSAVITATICFTIENTASKMMWWTNPVLEGDYMYPNFLLGYMSTTFWYLTFINYFTYPTFRDKRILRFLMCVWITSFIRELSWDPKIIENRPLFISLIGIAAISIIIAMFHSKQFSFLITVMISCYIFGMVVDGYIPIEYRNFSLMLIYISLILGYGMFYLYPRREKRISNKIILL